MPPTTKKLLESLGGALMSVLVGVNHAGDPLVHLLTESTGDPTEVLLHTLLGSPDNHLNDSIHGCLLIHSLEGDVIPSDSTEKGSHLLIFIEFFLPCFIRLLIISSPPIILILLVVIIIIRVASKTVVVLVFIKLILLLFFGGFTRTTTVSSTIKHSLLLLVHFTLPLGLRGPMESFSSVSLCPCTAFAPVFYDFRLEGCCPSVHTTLAGDAESANALVVGDFATSLNGDLLSSLVDLLAVLAHPSAPLGLADDQLACAADLSVGLVLLLFVSFALSLGLSGLGVRGCFARSLAFFVRICRACSICSGGISIASIGFNGVPAALAILCEMSAIKGLPFLAGGACEDNSSLESLAISLVLGLLNNVSVNEILHIGCLRCNVVD